MTLRKALRELQVQWYALFNDFLYFVRDFRVPDGAPTHLQIHVVPDDM